MKLLLLQGTGKDLKYAAELFKHAANFAKWGKDALEMLEKGEKKAKP